MQIFVKESKQSNIIINAFKSHRKYKILKYLKFINSRFITSDFRNITNKNYEYSIQTLKSMEKDNIIKRLGYENNQNIWELTDFGTAIKDVISNV